MIDDKAVQLLTLLMKERREEKGAKEGSLGIFLE
jgi:hypothetical protein